MGTKAFIQDRTLFKKVDFNLVLTVVSLNCIGLINLYSATHGVNFALTSKFWKQLIWLFGGWSIFIVVTFINYSFFRRFAYVFYLLNLGCLVAVIFWGKSFYGAQRWLDFGWFRFQPSETIKLSIILVLARILSKVHTNEGLNLKDLLLPLGLTLVPFALTVKQPDLGTGLLIMAVAFSMLIFVKVRIPILIVTFIISLIALPVAWKFGLKEYQKNRVLTFVYPGRDPRGTGYNSIQSKIAVGSGRVFGKGFLKGTQSQLEFIPERHSDFIFSVLSEEHGFVGSFTTIGLFVILYLLGIRVAGQATDKFGALVVVGVLSFLFWHMFINIGMVIGLLPVVGVPLPLLSYGGSSLLTTMFGLGLISSVSYRKYLF